MQLNGAVSARKISCLIVLCAAFFLSVRSGYAQSIDETYRLALKDGELNVYGTLTPDTAMKVLPVFEKRFPGIKTVNTGASGDKIVARAISEARGGRTIGDVFHMNLENVMQVHEQGLVLDKLPPEADVFASHLKGTYWVATRFNTLVAAWNTHLIGKSDEPKSYEEFAEPKWKGKLLAEPRDAEFFSPNKDTRAPTRP
jgi:iron(III) transport system substrate-binding protein